jgi:Methionine aminopeptidase
MIILKTPDEIALMAQASRVVAETLQILQKAVRPGITTDELDRLAEDEIRSRGARPAFKGYRSYPKTLCASVNDQVVHGDSLQASAEGGGYYRA